MFWYLSLLIILAVLAVPCYLAWRVTRTLRGAANGWIPILLVAAGFAAAFYATAQIEGYWTASVADLYLPDSLPGFEKFVAENALIGWWRDNPRDREPILKEARGVEAKEPTPPELARLAGEEDLVEVIRGLAPAEQEAVVRKAMETTYRLEFHRVHFCLLLLAVVLFSILPGIWFAELLRMPDFRWKVATILFAINASCTILCTSWPPKLGVDLGGGVILVYQVDPEKRSAGGLDKDTMQQLITSVSKRVNPGGQKEITVRPLGSDKIQITIPQVGEEEARRIKSIISRAGTLEFRILATRHDDQALIERALAEPNRRDLKTSDGEYVEAKWVPVTAKEERAFQGDAQLARRTAKSGAMELLVKIDPYNVKGDYLKQALEDVDPKTARPCVAFYFNSTGGELFGQLTSANLPVENFFRRLGIILDGELYSAPTIQSAISEHGVITGNFTRAEVQDLVKLLNAGSLPAALEKKPVRDLTTGATLGGDTIAKSRLAMILSSILVPLFMLWYYRFAGLVAVLALSLNMLMLVAVMILVKAPFTLPALAGLALTVGMAVDNNVLIYERLREELAHGAALRMAVRNAFHRAGVVIIDANITHLIAATVLFVEGTEQVKGFAVTFWLGAVLSIWATMFVARAIFEVAERRHWITQVKMMHVIGHTNIDFMRWFPACATASLLITVLGLGVAFARQKGLFDIDFTGGVSVEAQFTRPQDIGVVRKDTEELPDVAVSNVRRLEDQQENIRFLINTSLDNLEEVKQELKKKFGNELVSNSLTISGVAAIPEAAKPQAEKAKPGAKGEKSEKGGRPAEKSESGEQETRLQLPPDTMIAMAGPAPVLLAQADKTAAKSPADQEPAPSPKSDEKAKPQAEEPPAQKPEEEPEEKPEEKPLAEKPQTGNPLAGGTQAELAFKFKVDHKTVEDLVKSALTAQGISLDDMLLELANPEYHGEMDTTPYDHWSLRIKLPREKTEAVLGAVQSQVGQMPYFPDVDAIGSAVASDTRYYAVIALVASWVLIILYLWVRFQGVAFGLAAVIALIHDVLVMLGAIAFSYYLANYIPWLANITMIEPFKINLQIVAAFLTIIGYSVNDTIVVFDRIREVRGKDPRMTRQMVNDGTNQTLGRTLLTSFTVLLVVVILYLVGGQALHGFAFALIIGVLTGTYSSIYVAAPILLGLIHPKQMMRETAGAAVQRGG
ncbi:MAG: protein translocase subunit SecD [Thermoguttaceae bacterium]